MATKIDIVVTYGGGTPPSKSHDLLIYGHMTSEKNLYLHFHNTYVHQTWYSGNLSSEDSTYLVKWPFDLMVTWQI